MIAKLKGDPIEKLKSIPDYEDLERLKIKTRLFVAYDLKEGRKYEKQVDEKLARFVRCLSCHAILTQEIAVQNYDENLVQSFYVP